MAMVRRRVTEAMERRGETRDYERVTLNYPRASAWRRGAVDRARNAPPLDDDEFDLGCRDPRRGEESTRDFDRGRSNPPRRCMCVRLANRCPAETDRPARKMRALPTNNAPRFYLRAALPLSRLLITR